MSSAQPASAKPGVLFGVTSYCIRVVVRIADFFSWPFNREFTTRWIDRPIRWFMAYPLLMGQILLYLAIAWGLVGGELGLTDLFWHGQFLNQFMVGMATGWLFGVVLFVNYLLLVPQDLPGLPRDSALQRQFFITLLPSSNPGVRVLGKRLLWWLLILVTVLYFGKLIAMAADDSDIIDEAAKADWFKRLTTNWTMFPFGGLVFILGYGFALLTAYLISWLDHEVGFRERIADAKWLDVSFKTSTWNVPTTRRLDAGHPANHRRRSAIVDLKKLIDEAAAARKKADDNPNDGVLEEKAKVAEERASAARPLLEETRKNNGRSIKVMHAMAVAIGLFMLLMLAIALSFPSLSPAVLMSVLLIGVDVVAGFIAFRVRGHRTLGLLVLAYLLIINSTVVTAWLGREMTFPNLPPPEPSVKLEGYTYRKIYSSHAPEDADPGLIDGEQLLAKFEARWSEHHKGSKPRLVVVAVSGGGIRASIWTAVVLERLESHAPLRDAKFRNHIRIISGASGGMVAAGAYAADFQPGRPLPTEPENERSGLLPFADALARDSLTPVVRTMLLRDFTLDAAMPWLPRVSDIDRGRTLENTWDQNFADAEWRDGSPLARSIRSLKTAEANCDRPSLIYCPMMVEDSKRLLISNLDLRTLTEPQAYRLDAEDKPEAAPLGLPAVEFFRLYDTATEFRVGTAARMSASFPIVSPAVAIPAEPRRRVVDAGYFDNYGIDVLGNWLLQNSDSVKNHTSGVLLIQIRAYPVEEENEQFKTVERSPVDVLLGAVSAPVQAVLSARGRAAYHRNNELLNALQKTFNGNKDDADFFATTVLEMNGPAALSWYLTDNQKRVIAQAFKAEQLNPEGADLRNTGSDPLAGISKWFGNGGR